MKKVLTLLPAAFLLFGLLACGADSGNVDASAAGFTVSPEQPDVGEEVTFDASDSSAGDPIESFEWDFGDGSTGTGEVVTHTYDGAGLMTVTLTITTTEGNTSTSSVDVPVGGEATAVISSSPEDLVRDFIVLIDGSSSSSNVGDIVSWNWEIDGEQVSTEETFSYFFEEAGQVDITLTVEDEFGNTDTTTETREIAEELGSGGGAISVSSSGELHIVPDEGENPGSDPTVVDVGEPLHSVEILSDGSIITGTDGGEIYQVQGGSASLLYDGHSSRVNALVEGPSGVIYSGSAGGNVHAVDPGGSQLWTYSLGDVVNDLGLEAGGDVIAGGGSGGTGTAARLNPGDGSEAWSMTTSWETIVSMVVDSNEGAIIGFQSGTFNDSVQIDLSSGAESSTLLDVGQTPAADGTFNEVVRGLSSGGVEKGEWASFSSDWTYGGHSGSVNDLVVSPVEDGGSVQANVFTASSDGTVHKVADSGSGASQVWTYDGHSDSVTGVDFGGEPAPKTLTLGQVQGEGTVFADGFELPPGVGMVVGEEGEAVQLEAVPDDEWLFNFWSDNVDEPESAQTTITVDESQEISVNFSPTVDLTLEEKIGEGTVQANGQTLQEGDSLSFELDSTVNLTAISDSNWTFTEWSENVDDPTSSQSSIVMDFDENITVNFQAVRTLTFGEQSGKGTVTANGQEMSEGDTITVFKDDQVSLEAQPDNNWLFGSWTGDVADSGSATTTITMNENKTVDATFLPDGNVLSLTSLEGNGTIEANGQSLQTGPENVIVFDEGETVNLTATPDQGYFFFEWSDNVADPTSNTTQITMDADKDITAQFGAIQVELTADSIQGQGSITAEGQQLQNDGDSIVVDWGTEVNLQANADSGWGFLEWSTNVDDPQQENTTITLTGDESISVTFLEVRELTLSEVNGDGTVLVNGNELTPGSTTEVFDGSPVNLEASAADGWLFSSWTGNVDDTQSAITSITMNQDETISVTFELIAPPVFSGGTGQTVHRIIDEGFSQAGSEWTFNQGSEIVSIDAEPNGGPAYAGDPNGNVYKMEPDGTGSLWYDGHSDRINAIAVDRDGNVYTGSEDGEIHRINADGSVEWTFDTGENYVRDIALDEGGDVYAGGGNAPSDNVGGSIRRINGDDGTEMWATTNLWDPAVAVGVDELNDYVYISNEEFDDLEIVDRQDGSIVTAIFAFGPLSSIDVTPAGQMILGWADGSLNPAVEKAEYNEVTDSVDLIWSYTQHTDNVNDVFYRPDPGFVFSGSSDGTVHKLNDEGSSVSQVWTYSGHSGEVQAVTGPTPPDPLLTLTSVSGNGTVTANGQTMEEGDSIVFSPQQTVNLEATPAQGLDFLFWSPNVQDNMSATTQITMEEDEDLQVVFGFPGQFEPSVFYGGEGQSVHRIIDGGSQVDTGSQFAWEYSAGEVITSIDALPGGPVFAGTAAGNVHRIDIGGNGNVWYSGHSGQINALAVDDQGFVYTASSDGEIHRITPGGSNDWVYTAGDPVQDLELVNGDVVATGNYPGGFAASVWRVSGSDGSEMWMSSNGFEGGFSMAVDEENELVYVFSNADGFAFWDLYWFDLTSGNFVDEAWGVGESPASAVRGGELIRGLSGGDTERGIPVGGGSSGFFGLEWVYSGHSGSVQDLDLLTEDGQDQIFTASADQEVHKLNDNADSVSSVWTYDQPQNGINAVSAPKVGAPGITLTSVTGAGGISADGQAMSEGDKLEFSLGQVVELSPEPNPGWVFDSWGGDISATDQESQEILIDGNVEVSISFNLEFQPVYTGGNDQDVHRINDAGGSLAGNEWVTGHSQNITAVAGLLAGNTYAGDAAGNVHEIQPDGTSNLWYTGHSDTINAIAVNAQGFVYTASDDGEVHRIAPDGTNDWTYNAGDTVNDLDLLTNGDVVVTNVDGFSDLVTRINGNDGTENWSTSFSFGPGGPVAVDEDNSIVYIFKVGSFPDGQWFNLADGNEIDDYLGGFTDPFTLTAEVRNNEIIRGKDDGEVQRGTVSGGFGGGFNAEWTYSGHSGEIQDLALTNFNGINGVISVGSDQQVHKMEDQGNSVSNLWTYTNHTDEVLAVDAPGTMFQGGGGTQSNSIAGEGSGSDDGSFGLDAPGDDHTLTVDSIQGQGTVSVDGQVLAEGDSITLPWGEPFSLEGNADAGWTFGSWSGSIAVRDRERATTTIRLREDTSLSVNFVEEKTLTIFDKQGFSQDGLVVVENQVVNVGDTLTFPEGKVVRLRARADQEHLIFAKWFGDVTAPEDNHREIFLTMDQDRSVAGAFRQKAHGIRLTNITGSGTVSLNGSQINPGKTHKVPHGDTVTLEASPASGWQFLSWSGGRLDSTLQFEVTESVKLSVAFTEQDLRVLSGSTSDGTLSALTLDGSSDWTQSLSSSINDVAVDADGNLYLAVGGDNSSENAVQKRDDSGSLLWSHTVDGSPVTAVAVDRSGFVYAGTSDQNVDRLDAEGNHDWTWSGDDAINSLAVDQWGHLFVGTDGIFSGESLIKLNVEDHSTEWVYDGLTDVVNAVTTDPGGRVYAGGTSQEIHRVSRSGNTDWTVNVGAEITSLAVSADGIVMAGDTTGIVHRYTAQGSEEWIYEELTGSVTAMSIDEQGNVFAGTGNNELQKVSRYGDSLWSSTVHGAPLGGVAVEPGTAGAGFRDWEGNRWLKAGNTTERTSESTDLSADLSSANAYAEIDGIVTSSPAIADLNGDSEGDIVVGVQEDPDNNSSGPGIYAGSYDSGGFSELWFTGTDEDVAGSPVVADVNGDGSKEIIVGTGSARSEEDPGDHYVHALDPSDGSILWSFTVTDATVPADPVTLATGDGHRRVLVGATDGYLYAIDGSDGSEAWSLQAGAEIVGGPALGDINGDGLKEIVVGAKNSGGVHALRADGSQIWHTNEVASTKLSPVISQIDHQSRSTEVLVGSTNGRLVLFDGADGDVKWTYNAGDALEAAPSTGDLNEDGSREILLGTVSGALRALDSSGQEIWSHSASSGNRGIQASAAIAGEARSVLYTVSGTLYHLNPSDGSVVNSWTSAGNENISRSAPVTGDLTGNLTLESVWISRNGNIHVLSGTP